jgi:hypothetical protein
MSINTDTTKGPYLVVVKTAVATQAATQAERDELIRDAIATYGVDKVMVFREQTPDEQAATPWIKSEGTRWIEAFTV